MGSDEQLVYYGLCAAVLVIFLGVIWIFTSLAAYRRTRKSDTEDQPKSLFWAGCVAAPIVALFDILISLGKSLAKIIGVVLGVILVALALLLSPLLLIIYLAYLAIKRGSEMGDRLLQNTIEFPDRVIQYTRRVEAWFENLLGR